MRHDAAAQHTEQMEELCDCHQNVPRAIQVELRDDRIIVRPMLERLARNQSRAVGGRNVEQVNIITVRAIKKVMKVLMCVFVNVAEVNGERVVTTFLLEGMGDFNPIVDASYIVDGWFAVDLALLWA